MTSDEWVSDIRIYCDMLVDINKDILKLVALDCIGGNSISKMEQLFLNVSQNLTRIIPCRIKDEEKKELTLIRNEGILNLSTNLDFIESDYNMLLSKHNDKIFDIKFIRNKAEHIPHKLRAKSFYSGNNCFSSINFVYMDYKYEINTKEIIEILIDLNSIFSKIIEALKKFRDTLDEEDQNHPYFEKYANLDFNRFNKLLNDNILYDVSKIIQDF